MNNTFKILFFLFSFALQANEVTALDKYYTKVFLGERYARNYSGPLDSRSVFTEEYGKDIFLDDLFYENHLNANFEQSIFDLNKFWFNKVLDKSTCPDEELGEHFDYIRYLFRLVSMSYLFESIKMNNRISEELGFVKNSCELSYSEMFKNCNPISDDMKKFKERVYGKFANEFEKSHYSALSKKDTESWMDLFKLSSPQSLDPTFSRLHTWCSSSGKNCKSIDIKEINSAINLFCERDKRTISLICNEKDQSFGISSNKIAEELVRTSNAFNLINKRGMGEDCLRRFVKVNTGKETTFKELNFQYSSIYSYLKKENASYLQGSLFLPGALKEFDVKGLSDFLSALKPPKVIVARAVIPKVKPKIIPVKVIAEKKVEVVEVIPVVEPEPVVLPKISEFERARIERATSALDSIAIDMDKFREDFEFTSKMISGLSLPMKKFQTLKALKDMKDYDRFGSIEAPVGLIFLKFLIDTENHQGLYNVISVLGDKFYISNDFENNLTPVFAQIKNDASTKNRWQISLLKPQMPKK